MQAKLFAAPAIIETPDNESAEEVGKFLNIANGVVASLFNSRPLFCQGRLWLVGTFRNGWVEECTFIGHDLKRFSGLRTRCLGQQGGESIVGKKFRELYICDLARDLFIGLSASLGGDYQIGKLLNADFRRRGRNPSHEEQEDS